MSPHIRCPVCGSGATRPFLERPSVPVHQNLIYATRSDAESARRGEMTLCCCEGCGFVHNASFDLSAMSYGESYDNTQTCSPTFNRYVDDLVRHLVEEKGVRDSRVVEVGCGKGVFLRKLVEYPGAGITGHGFDPTYQGPATELDGRLSFHTHFYDERSAAYEADVVVCRHVIEHVPRPLELLGSVRRAVRCRDRVFFETPCVEWILRNKVIWDFFYEHCSLFTASSLRTAFERSGFRVESVTHVFGGQYLWIEATADEPSAGAEHRAAGDIPRLGREFGAFEQDRIGAWRSEVKRMAARGRVALWGAGAKGVTFANLVDDARDLLWCVVDVNPAKHGKFLAGTGHRIVAPDALGDERVDRALILNPNYYDEISLMLGKNHLDVEVVDLMRRA